MLFRKPLVVLLIVMLVLQTFPPTKGSLLEMLEEGVDMESEEDMQDLAAALIETSADSKLQVMGCSDAKFMRYMDEYAKREDKDKAPVKVNPAPCCAANDACYKICMNDKKGCDDAFHSCFKGLCAAFAKAGPYDIKNPQLNGECLSVAALHYGSLRKKPGVDAYKQDQNDGCPKQLYPASLAKIAPDMAYT